MFKKWFQTVKEGITVIYERDPAARNILEILFEIDKDITAGSLIEVEGTRLRI